MNFKKKIYIAVLFGVIGFIYGGITTYQNPTGNTSDEILAVEKRLQSITDEIGKPVKEDPKIILVVPNMEEVSEAVKSLTLDNQRIGMAKVMMKIDIDISSEKLPWNAPQWEDRYKYGNKTWLVQEKYQLIGRSLFFGLVSFTAVCVSTFLFVIVLPFIWYFLLERIKELSAAIKGK